MTISRVADDQIVAGAPLNTTLFNDIQDDLNDLFAASSIPGATNPMILGYYFGNIPTSETVIGGGYFPTITGKNLVLNLTFRRASATAADYTLTLNTAHASALGLLIKIIADTLASPGNYTVRFVCYRLDGSTKPYTSGNYNAGGTNPKNAVLWAYYA